MVRRAVWVLVVFINAGLVWGADIQATKAPFAMSEWQYVRMRKGKGGESNVVSISFKLKNLTGKSIERLNITMDLQESMGGKAGSLKSETLRYIKPDEETDINISGTFVPVFSMYFLNFEYRIDRENYTAMYLGTSPYDGATFIPAKPEGRNIRLMVMGYDFQSDTKKHMGLLSIKLKNLGGLPARRPTVRFRIYGNDRKLLGQIQGQELRSKETPKDQVEEIKPGDERTYQFPLYNVPSYDSFDVFVNHDPPRPEETLPGDKFTDAKEIEVIITGAKVEGRSLKLDCKARNGLDKPIAKLSVDFSLMSSETVVDKEGRETPEKKSVKVASSTANTGLSMEPGEEKEFKFEMPLPAKNFQDYSFQVSYEEPGQEMTVTSGEGAAELGKIDFQVTGGERLKTGGVRLEGYAEQNGGNSEVEVNITFIFVDAQGNETTRKELTLQVPANSKKYFNETYAEITNFASYNVQMGEVKPVKKTESAK